MEQLTTSTVYPSNQSTNPELYTDGYGSDICPPLHITPLIITAGIVSFGIIFGNCLVIIAIVGGGSKLFRPMYWFIIHLSCTDILVGLMLLWNYCLAAVFSVSNTKTSLLTLQAVWVTSACSSVLGILLLAIDRYMQVVHRRLYNIYFNQRTVSAAIFCAWVIPTLLFLVIPLALNWSCKDSCKCQNSRYMECSPSSECSQVIPPFKKSFILFCLLYLFLIMPWPVLIYSLIFIRARKSTQALHQKMRHRDARLIRTLIAIMLAFIITLTPAGVIMAIDYSMSHHSEKLVDYAVYLFVVAASNSLLNPILYIWRIPAIRVSLEHTFRCCYKSVLNQNSRISRNGNKSHGNFNSEQGQHSYAPNPLHSPFTRKPAIHLSFGRPLSLNFSDTSQNSTPLSQRSLKKPAKISKKKRAKIFEMQKLSPDIHLRTPLQSSLCSDSGSARIAKNTSKLLERPSSPKKQLSPRCVIHSYPNHSNLDDVDEIAAPPIAL